jgi:hypothetical protein
MSLSVAGLSAAGIQFERGLPLRALAPDLAKIAVRKLLVLGTLPRLLERALDGAGARVALTSSILEAHRALAAQTFDVVIVEPEIPGAIDLVKKIKLPTGAASLRSASDRHAFAPFFVLPFAGETEYAVVIQAPQLAFLVDAAEVPLATAVVRLDVWRLLGRA